MKTHCRNGHALTPGNFSLYSKPNRATTVICLECKRVHRAREAKRIAEASATRRDSPRPQPFEQLRDPWEAAIFGGAQV